MKEAKIKMITCGNYSIELSIPEKTFANRMECLKKILPHFDKLAIQLIMLVECKDGLFACGHIDNFDFGNKSILPIELDYSLSDLDKQFDYWGFYDEALDSYKKEVMKERGKNVEVKKENFGA